MVLKDEKEKKTWILIDMTVSTDQNTSVKEL